MLRLHFRAAILKMLKMTINRTVYRYNQRHARIMLVAIKKAFKKEIINLASKLSLPCFHLFSLLVSNLLAHIRVFQSCDSTPGIHPVKCCSSDCRRHFSKPYEQQEFKITYEINLTCERLAEFLK